MILVVLGTQNMPFNRLLEYVEKAINQGIITDDVMVQAGHTKYNSEKMNIFDFCGVDEFGELIKKSDYIITHGGVGCILESVMNQRPTLVVPRLAKYGEHENDHQLEISYAFEKAGYILTANNEDEFLYEINNLKTFKPKEYVSNNKQFCKMIVNMIEE